MAKVIKVCVRIPSDRQADLLAIAAGMRSIGVGGRSPGWDARLIHAIAREKFGGLEGMFEHHGWPERGPAMLPAVQRQVKATYGSVEAFEAKVGSAPRRASN
jgi:hypothetical protein